MMAVERASAPPLGTLVRMRALKPAELPAHPKLAHEQTRREPPPLNAFIGAVIEEACGFISTYLPATFKVKDENKPSPPAAASVELSHHEISAHDIPEEGRTMGAPEIWFARTSMHENEAKSGTASWKEFDGGLRADHSQHEKEYTPDVMDAHRVLDWKAELEGSAREVGEWNEVDVAVMEMMHKIPFPLSDRVFHVLVVTAKKDHDFIVVQIPVDTSKISEAKYQDDSKTTIGTYCSIERVELIEQDTKVRWQMAMASDAKGFMPMWAQKMGAPGAIVKDVGLFIDWCDQRRKGDS